MNDKLKMILHNFLMFMVSGIAFIGTLFILILIASICQWSGWVIIPFLGLSMLPVVGIYKVFAKRSGCFEKNTGHPFDDKKTSASDSTPETELIEGTAGSEVDSDSEEKYSLSHKEDHLELWTKLQDYEKFLTAKDLILQRREQELEEKEQTVYERMRLQAAKNLSDTQQAIEELQERIASLQRAELAEMDMAQRIEKKERAVFDGIMADAEKYKKYGQNIDGFEFEERVAAWMRQSGYTNVIVTQKSRDFGADITAEQDGVKFVVQCKYYKSQVGIEAVQQIHSAKGHYDAHVAVVATNSVFSTAAKTLAQELNVLLWDCEKIASLDTIQAPPHEAEELG